MTQVRTSLGKVGVASNLAGFGDPVVFLHGVGSTKTVWQAQMDHFGGRRPVVAIDYPGYGESDPLPDANRDDFAQLGWAVLDALGHKQAHLCGLSLGGVVAIAMHAAAPQRCRTLILADTFAVHPDGPAILERSITGSADMPAFAGARVPMLLGPDADPTLCAAVAADMAAIDPAAYRIAARAVWAADQRDRARAIDVPTLILCGTQDRATPPQLSRDLHALVPGSRLELIKGAGHLSNLERPNAFNAAVGRFLDDVDRGGR